MHQIYTLDNYFILYHTFILAFLSVTQMVSRFFF